MRAVSERDHRQGRLDAPLLLVEYGDFECPDCKAAYPVVQALRAQLGADLCFVYRHFPLAKHPFAQPAAEAAEAAGAQGLFWEMHRSLFEHSPDLDDLPQFAAGVGADVGRFTRELHDQRYRRRVDDDRESGTASGVQGTPAFFINGERYEGGHDLESLVDALRIPR
jgi:protein-disulfide isomerase